MLHKFHAYQLDPQYSGERIADIDDSGASSYGWIKAAGGVLATATIDAHENLRVYFGIPKEADGALAEWQFRFPPVRSGLLFVHGWCEHQNGHKDALRFVEHGIQLKNGNTVVANWRLRPGGAATATFAAGSQTKGRTVTQPERHEALPPGSTKNLVHVNTTIGLNLVTGKALILNGNSGLFEMTNIGESGPTDRLDHALLGKNNLSLWGSEGEPEDGLLTLETTVVDRVALRMYAPLATDEFPSSDMQYDERWFVVDTNPICVLGDASALIVSEIVNLNRSINYSAICLNGTAYVIQSGEWTWQHMGQTLCVPSTELNPGEPALTAADGPLLGLLALGLKRFIIGDYQDIGKTGSGNPSAMRAALIGLIEQISANGAPPILCTPLPRGEASNGEERTEGALAEAIGWRATIIELAATYHCPVIDLWSIYADQDGQYKAGTSYLGTGLAPSSPAVLVELTEAVVFAVDELDARLALPRIVPVRIV